MDLTVNNLIVGDQSPKANDDPFEKSTKFHSFFVNQLTVLSQYNQTNIIKPLFFIKLSKTR